MQRTSVKNRSFRTALLASCLGIALATAACGSGESTKASPAAGGDRCDASQAKKEGSLVYYSADEPNQIKAISKAFAEKYPGVKVQTQVGRGKDAREKVIAEQAAGRVLGDVVLAGTNTLSELGELGYLVKYRAPGTKAVYDGLLTDGGYDNPRDVNVYGITVNTKMVPLEDRPRDWSDLTDPKYRGLMASQDPRGSGGAMFVFAALLEKQGEGFIADLAKQKYFFGESNSQLVTDLVRGEFGILTSSNASAAAPLREEGAPIEFIRPESGVILIPISMAIVKDAPHPAAAHCFVDWMMSKEGQTLTASLDSTPARTDVPAKDASQQVGGKVLESTYDGANLQETADLTKRWQSIFFD